ncbi:MAG TPA: hypothetical protein VEI54_09135 [Candidatus Limnocylindrales bacterium]|nr:hypothetical protein [Candidatus Limnocylindrales bacterium]
MPVLHLGFFPFLINLVNEMPLPDQITVRYSDEDAGYVSMRPVVRQTFRLSELIDMVVSVAGKDASRIQQIFRTGTVIYNGYRYWWDSLEVTLPELEPLLASFPDDDPERPFDPAHATAVLWESGGGTQRNIVEISRQEAAEKKFFTKASPWDVFLQLAAAHPPRYEQYLHARRADLFRIALPYDRAQQLLAVLLDAAPRALRHRWSTLRPPASITFVCSR